MDPLGPSGPSGPSAQCFPELNQSCSRLVLSPSMAMLRVALLYSISPITVVLNLLVIVAVAHFRQLHTPTNLLLLSLAVSDLLVGLVLMPGEMMRQSGCWLFGQLVCVSSLYLAYVTVSASVNDMVLISVDRYMAICDPLHYSQRITMFRVSVALACSWAFSLIYAGFILKEILQDPERTSTCVGECLIVLDFVVAAVDMFVGFILPVGFILIINLVVLVVVLSQARSMRAQVAVHAPQRPAKRPWLKAARSLGVLVLIFLVCFMPYQCFSLVGSEQLNSPFISLLLFLVYINSCLNPLVYAFFYPWFRKAVRLIVTLQIFRADSCQANMS